VIELNHVLRQRDLGYVVLTVHDSIEGEIRQERVDEACQVIWDVMSKTRFETNLPYHPVEVKVGPSWGTTKIHEIKEPAWTVQNS